MIESELTALRDRLEHATRQPEFATIERRQRARTRRRLAGAGCLLVIAAASITGLATLRTAAPTQRIGSTIMRQPHYRPTSEMTGLVTSVHPKLCIGGPRATGTCFRTSPEFRGSVNVGDCVRVVYMPRPAISRDGDSGLALDAAKVASCP